MPYLGGSYQGTYQLGNLTLPRLLDLGNANAVVGLGTLALATVPSQESPAATAQVFSLPVAAGPHLQVRLAGPALALRLVNQLGQLAYARSLAAATPEYRFPTADRAPGRYMLQVLPRETAVTRAVVIE